VASPEEELYRRREREQAETAFLLTVGIGTFFAAIVLWLTKKGVLNFRRDFEFTKYEAKKALSPSPIAPRTPGAPGRQLADTRTPVSPQELANALVALWPSEVGGSPSLKTIAVLLAQWALETGEGKSMVAYNIGNIKAYDTKAGDYTYFDTTENVNGKTVHLKAGEPGTRFRAFSSLPEGAQFYLRGMKSHWTKAWPYALSGDPEGFAQGLYDQHYYTGIGDHPVEAYAKGLRAYFDKYMRSINLYVS
jgi:hypothetical protein